MEKTLTVSEAQRAIYIDFEGFKGKPLTAFPSGRILVRRGSGHAWPIPTPMPQRLCLRVTLMFIRD